MTEETAGETKLKGQRSKKLDYHIFQSIRFFFFLIIWLGVQKIQFARITKGQLEFVNFS